MDHGAETGLAFDDHVGDTHLAAKSGEENDQLDGVDIVGDDDERRLLCLDESDTVVQSVLDEKRFLVLRMVLINKFITPLDTNLCRLLFFGGSFGSSLKTFLLFDLGLWAVFVEKLEKLRSSVFVESVGELGNSWGNLQALREDNLLALKADVLWPLDEASEVSFGTDVLA